ncbi:MAG: DUF2059 domain-containing protein [Candidatus Firestonebacteria bacterium]
MKKLFSVLALVLLLAAPLFAAGTTGSEKNIADIKKLLELTGGAKLAGQMLEQMKQYTFKMIAEKTKDEQMDAETQALTKKYIEKRLENLLNEKSMQEMLDLSIPIYDKYMTNSEINDIIKFYESPTGKKMVAATPLIMKECLPLLLEQQKAKMKEFEKDEAEMLKEIKKIAEDRRKAKEEKENK